MTLISFPRLLVALAWLKVLLDVGAAGASVPDDTNRSPPRPLWMTAEETKPFREQSQLKLKKYMAAVDAATKDMEGYHLSKLTTREAIRAKRQVLETYRAESAEYAKYAASSENREEILRRDLERQGISAERTAVILESFRRTTAFLKERRDLIDTEKTAEDFVALICELLDLAEANLGRWRVEGDGRVVFTDAGFQKKYLEFSQRSRAYQKKLESEIAASDARMEEARERLKKKKAASAAGD